MYTYKLTIITVTFNNLRGLERTFESVKDLLFSKALEWVIIDGGSNDGTVEFLDEKIPKQRNIVYLSEKDKGIYDAMNKGISLARGQFIWFLNSGDLSNIQSLDLLPFNEFKGINVFNIQALDKNLKPLVWKGLTENIEFLKKYPSIPHQSTIFSKEIFFKFGFYSLDFIILSDYEKYCNFYSKGVSFKYFLRICLASFVYDGVSSKFSNSKKIFKELEVIQKKYFGKISRKVQFFYLSKYYLSMIFPESFLNKIRPLVYWKRKNE